MSNLSVAYISKKKYPAYGIQRFSRLMRIVGPIQFWRDYVNYLFSYLYFYYFFLKLSYIKIKKIIVGLFAFLVHFLTYKNQKKYPYFGDHGPLWGGGGGIVR